MSVQELDSLNQSGEPAREWATKLQTAHNWAEVLMQLSQLKADFRDEVWKFWQLDIFGESDFPSKADKAGVEEAEFDGEGKKNRLVPIF